MENQDSFISNPALVEEPEKAPVENPDVQTSDMVATTDEITVVDSPIHHHSILSDHQLEVDGVIYRELKTLNRVVIQVLLQTTNNSFSFLILAFRFLFYLFFFKFQDGPDAGKDDQVLVHTRSIGDKDYTVKKINSEGSPEEVVEEKNLTVEEISAFQEDWDKNWNPSLAQPKEGGIKEFFKKMLGYE